jgi:phage terminase small subunit
MTETTDISWAEGLTEKQRRFCEAYSSNGGNAMDAAREAGYKAPKQQGAENLEKPVIRSALEKMREKTTNAAIATREERQSFWTSAMRSTDNDMTTRLKASELLGKSQADFVDRREITGANGDPLRILLDEISGKSIGPK